MGFFLILAIHACLLLTSSTYANTELSFTRPDDHEELSVRPGEVASRNPGLRQSALDLALEAVKLRLSAEDATKIAAKLTKASQHAMLKANAAFHDWSQINALGRLDRTLSSEGNSGEMSHLNINDLLAKRKSLDEKKEKMEPTKDKHLKKSENIAEMRSTYHPKFPIKAMGMSMDDITAFDEHRETKDFLPKSQPKNESGQHHGKFEDNEKLKDMENEKILKDITNLQRHKLNQIINRLKLNALRHLESNQYGVPRDAFRRKHLMAKDEPNEHNNLPFLFTPDSSSRKYPLAQYDMIKLPYRERYEDLLMNTNDNTDNDEADYDEEGEIYQPHIFSTPSWRRSHSTMNSRI
ncbi:unnamed protein product [Protopolystoma xenopodis]|uniref:Uncharacterized protein n=1 Tax=Protopolystoma xenopodis TaxID=117903 RepID=A0A3S5A1F6_9PLAT|nr:unnamed protein product [Protopolystoma xenopodis]